MQKKYNRNIASIIGKLQSIGIYKCVNHKFSKEDIDFLRENYPSGNWDKIFEHFGDNVSRASILTKVSKLGILQDVWNSHDVELLKNNIGSTDDNKLVKLFNGKYTPAAIKTKAFKDLGYSTSRIWLKHEDEILYKYYQIAPIKEVCFMLPNRTKNAIITHARKFNLNAYGRNLWSDSEKQYIIDNWALVPDVIMAKNLGRTFRATKAKREELQLYRRDMNSTTYESISKYMRGKIQSWKISSMKACDYKCVFTDSKDFQIHHLYGVSNLISDIFKNTYIEEKKDICDYSEAELNYLATLFIKEQDKYPLGICVSKEIHMLFHSLYGQYYNTPEQWYQFENDYRNGAYDFLKETA